MTKIEPTDAELVAKCLVARDAFAQLYERHAPAVFAFLKQMHRGDEHAASDSLQETFLRVYRALDRFDRARPLRPWLFTIASRVAQDARARERRVQTHDPSAIGELAGAAKDGGPASSAESSDAFQSIVRATDGKLEPRKLAAFLLARGQGLSYDEIAIVHDCSTATVKRDLKDALAALAGAAAKLGLVES